MFQHEDTKIGNDELDMEQLGQILVFLPYFRLFFRGDFVDLGGGLLNYGAEEVAELGLCSELLGELPCLENRVVGHASPARSRRTALSPLETGDYGRRRTRWQ